MKKKPPYLSLLKYSIPLLLCLAILAGCQARKESNHIGPKYLRWVGDIEADKKNDDPKFALCGSEGDVRQYFNMSKGLQFEGEKEALDRLIRAQYKPVSKADQNGWIRVRFIVNCKGESGRFRLLEADEHYKERAFSKKISKQLLEITTNLEGWKPIEDDGKAVDYYQYLTFKIEAGTLTDILP